MRGPFTRFLAAGGLTAVAVASGCSFIFDYNSAQCEATEDCQALFPNQPGITCSAERICTLGDVSSSSTGGTGGGTGCTSNQECVDQNGGLPYMCRRHGQQCTSLLSADCTQVLGEYTNENAIVLAYMSSFTGPFSFSGPIHLSTLQLALDEFDNYITGIPGPNGVRRPLVVVVCDEYDDAVRAAHHLVDNVRVSAIIGPDFSSHLIPVANEVTISAGVLTFSAEAGSPVLADLADNELVWSGAPNLAALVVPQAKMMEEVEAYVRADLGMAPSETIRLAIIAKNDAANGALANQLVNILKVNGESVLAQSDPNAFRRYDYSEDFSLPQEFSTIIANTLAFSPHIILPIGGIESYSGLMVGIEQQWPGGPPRPYWAPIGHDQVASVGLLTNSPISMNGMNEDLRKRYRGTDFAVQTTANYDSWLVRLNAVKPPEQPIGPYDHILYDVTYMVALGILAAGPNVATDNLTGSLLAGGLARLNAPGVPINVHPDDLNKAVNILVADTQGDAVDLIGVSGQLEFEVATGVQKAEAIVACIDSTYTSVTVQTWDYALGDFTSAFSCP